MYIEQLPTGFSPSPKASKHTCGLNVLMQIKALQPPESDNLRAANTRWPLKKQMKK
jgi:hypothetical protein